MLESILQSIQQEVAQVDSMYSDRSRVVLQLYLWVSLRQYFLSAKCDNECRRRARGMPRETLVSLGPSPL